MQHWGTLLTDAATLSELHRNLTLGFESLRPWSRTSSLCITHQLIFCDAVRIFQFDQRTPMSAEYQLRMLLCEKDVAHPHIVKPEERLWHENEFECRFLDDPSQIVTPLRAALQDALVQEWLDYDREIGAISTHSKAHGGLFNPGHIDYLAAIMDVPVKRIHLLREQAGDWRLVQSACETDRNSSELDHLLASAYTLSAMLRGFVHAEVARYEIMDANHHPIREFAVAAALPAQHVILEATAGEMALAALALAYGLGAAKDVERESRFAECVGTLRDSLTELQNVREATTLSDALPMMFDWVDSHPFFRADEQRIWATTEAWADWIVTIGYLVTRLVGRDATPFDAAISKVAGLGAKEVAKRPQFRSAAKIINDPAKALRKRVSSLLADTVY